MLGKLKMLGTLFVAFGVALGLGLAPVSAVCAVQKSTADPTSNPTSVSRAKQSPVAARKKAEVSNADRSVRARPATRAKVGKASGPGVVNARQRDDSSSPNVKSGAAIVVEQGGGGALFQKNANAVVPIASITKLMTAMVVLDAWPDLYADILVTDDDVDYLRGSRSRLHVGATMTRETALLLALMSSENRAAHALARHYPGGLPAFLSAMNIKAQSLGMRNTHFEDPTGLTSDNVSTARDLAKMVLAAYRYPIIREFSTMPEATVEVSGQFLEFHNTNPLVKNAGWDVGLSKTGYIHEAGKCLVMQARVADKPVVIVLLDSAGKLTRVADANRIKRWMEATHASSGAREQRASFESLGARPG
jgi:D-alanyl-D-alanine endopeptidase (penicillin-binding protein 7)